MGLIDSHAHLNDSRLNASQIIEDMHADGLEKIITVGYDVASSRFNSRLASLYSDVYASAGIHPSDANEATIEDLEQIKILCGQEKVVALGEIGLDYHYPNIDKVKQEFVFTQQLKIAKCVDLPVIIHLRDAYADMRRLVSQNLDCFNKSAVMHCFSGSKEEAQFYIKNGFYISFAGAITFSNARYEDVIRSVPLNKLLIETDCPYLTPVPFRGKTNYPKYVRFVCQKVADVLNKSYQEIEEITANNAKTLFGI